jgi:hypothetical protein
MEILGYDFVRIARWLYRWLDWRIFGRRPSIGLLERIVLCALTVTAITAPVAAIILGFLGFARLVY